MGKAYTQRVSVNVYSSDRTHMRVALTLLCISDILPKTAVYCTPLKLCIPKTFVQGMPMVCHQKLSMDYVN